jgi:hypothetical protein
LLVVPELISPRDVVSSRQAKIAGPAIQVWRWYGDTSGRNSVAEIIARVFPTHKQFVTEVAETFELPSDAFAYGPYPNDVLRYKGPTAVEYRTPPGKEGLGTYRWQGGSDKPISGAAMLVGSSPDVVLLAVQLPDGMDALTAAIVARFEQDAPKQMP